MKPPLSTRIARWMRRTLPAPRFAVAYEPALRTPMPDGVELVADHYFPTPGTLRDYPTLLVRSPYGRGSPWAALYGLGFAAQGFHVLLQSARDNANVDGNDGNDGNDGRATIAWLRRQAWFDGRLGLVGHGAMTRAHWALAADPPPELKAVVMQVPDVFGATERLTVPTLVVTGWADTTLDQALQLYSRAPTKHRSLLVGPWTHTSALRQGIGTVFAESLAWLHGHLTDPAPPPKRIRVALGGTSDWRDLTTWPPPAVPLHWYPHPDGTLSCEPPQDGIHGERAGLAFTGQPLTAPLDVIGAVAAEILIELGAAELTVQLYDIDKRGRPHSVCVGTTHLTGTSPSAVTVAMSSTAHRFLPGHRIRLRISAATAGHAAFRTRIHPGSAIVLPAT